VRCVAELVGAVAVSVGGLGRGQGIGARILGHDARAVEEGRRRVFQARPFVAKEAEFANIGGRAAGVDGTDEDAVMDRVVHGAVALEKLHLVSVLPHDVDARVHGLPVDLIVAALELPGDGHVEEAGVVKGADGVEGRQEHVVGAPHGCAHRDLVKGVVEGRGHGVLPDLGAKIGEGAVGDGPRDGSGALEGVDAIAVGGRRDRDRVAVHDLRRIDVGQGFLAIPREGGDFGRTAARGTGDVEAHGVAGRAFFDGHGEGLREVGVAPVGDGARVDGGCRDPCLRKRVEILEGPRRGGVRGAGHRQSVGNDGDERRGKKGEPLRRAPHLRGAPPGGGVAVKGLVGVVGAVFGGGQGVVITANSASS